MEYAWVVSSDNEVERPPGEPIRRAMQGTKLGAVFECLVRMNEGTRHQHLRQRVASQLAAWDRDRIASTAAEAATRLAPPDVAAYTIAIMIGITDAQAALPLIHDFARGVAATEPLLALLPPSEDFAERANALGFLFQATAATARLIENRLQGRPGPPVLMTRRWASRHVEICGKTVRRGDAMVVLLTSPRFYFGAGRHQCPGEDIAMTIAQTVVPSVA